MFVVKGKSGKVIGRYPTREAAARRIAQLKAGAQRLAPYKFGSARSPVAGGFDEHAATELRLYLDNDRALYDRKMNSFIPNVRRKIEQGKYDPALAPKLWIYLVDDAAKKYTKEFGNSGDHIFTPATRHAVAAQLAKDELQMLMNGEYGPPPALKQKKGRLAHSPSSKGAKPKPTGWALTPEVRFRLAMKDAYDDNIPQGHNNVRSIATLYGISIKQAIKVKKEQLKAFKRIYG